MPQATAERGDYGGEPAVWLRAGGYEACVLPEIGANLIALRHIGKGYKLLREPQTADDLRKSPITYGMPVLFPPNRFADGAFVWNGRRYALPVNEPARGNHLHGFLYDVPWTAERLEASEEASGVTLVLRIDRDHKIYEHWPHCLTFRLHYTLDADGLRQRACIRNEDETAMPCMLGFHTAVNAPFAPDGDAEHCRVKLTIGERIAMDERMLPTGRTQPLTREEQALRREGVNPFFAAMDHHYTARPEDGRNRMELTDERTGATVVYEVGSAYKHWMVWNNGATAGFFCPEPQMNMVNAPNVPGLTDEEKGLVTLGPGESWEETCRLYVAPRE